MGCLSNGTVYFQYYLFDRVQKQKRVLINDSLGLK